jgi:hypothetical protein
MQQRSHNGLVIFKEWSNLTGSQQWAVAAILLGALVNIVVYIFFGGPTTFYTLVVTTATTIALDRISKFSLENKTLNAIEKIELSERDLHFIGHSVEGQTWLSRHSVGLTSVDNTVFRTYEEGRFRIQDELDQHVSDIRNSIRDGCYWRDLVLLEEDGRLIGAFYNELKPVERARYSAAALHSELPLFQVMIMRYDYRITDQKNTVLFGWTFKSGRSSLIFESCNAEVVAYFEHYYDALYSKAQILYKRSPPLPNGENLC